MELNPRRGRKDEGRIGHGMGEDDSHAGRKEQERKIWRGPSSVRRGLAGRAAGRGRGGSPTGAGRGRGGPPAGAEMGRRRKQEGAAMEREVREGEGRRESLREGEGRRG